MFRKYRKLMKNDRAVSPVIAVILMVAITVVLAATVYVWVSGFSGGQGAAAKTISLSSNGPITNADGNADQYKIYTVTSATSGMKYSDLRVTLNGAGLDCDTAQTNGFDTWRPVRPGTTFTCPSATDGTGPDAVVQAGDTIEIYDNGATDLSGKTLRILDSQANSVMYTLNIG